MKVKGGMALRNGIWNGMRNDMRNDCGMAKRIKFRDIFSFGAFLNFILKLYHRIRMGHGFIGYPKGRNVERALGFSPGLPDHCIFEAKSSEKCSLFFFVLGFCFLRLLDYTNDDLASKMQ